MSEPQRDPLDELREYIANQTDHIKALSPGMAMFDDDLDRLADAWESEREDYVATVCRLSDNLTACQEQNGRVSSVLRKVRTEYQAKLESMTKDRDEWRSTYENVSPDVMQKMSELQAKLDASESYNSALRTECTDLRDKLNTRTIERDGLQSFLDASIPLPPDADGVPCRIGDDMENMCCRFVVYGYVLEGATPDTFGKQKPGGKMLLWDGAGWESPSISVHVSPKTETIEDVRAYIRNIGWRFQDLYDCAKRAVDDAYECGRRDGDKYASGGYVSDPSVISGDGADADISGHCPKSNGTASIGNGTCPDGEPF